MTRETAFHSSFAKHTRNFVEYKGYWLANSFAKAGPIEEYWACREKAVVMDLSPLRKFEVTGPDSEALLQYALTRDVKKLGVGQVVYSRHVLRAWRHDRRRHAAPARPGQFPLDRRRRLSAASGCASRRRSSASRCWCARRPTRCTISPCRGRRAATSSRRSSGPRRCSRRSPSSNGSASRSPASAMRKACRSSSRAPAIPASSATRSCAIRATPKRCSTRCGRPASRMG